MLLCHVCVSIVCCVLVDEFWDYEEQVDLEAFSASTFYDILLRHSVSVTARLGQLRGEVRIHTHTHTHTHTHIYTVYIYIYIYIIYLKKKNCSSLNAHSVTLCRGHFM